MEAWRRGLNDPVRAFAIEKAGPAHIATLKTFDPPLTTLEGHRLAGAERRGKRVFYRLADERVANVVDLTKSLLVDNQDHAARFKVRA